MINILIAEDYELLREDLVEMLSGTLDIEVVGKAKNSEEIIELARMVPFDIILMDIEMEVQYAGIYASMEILKHNASAKIIFLSVHESKEIILNAIGTGAVDYVVKGASIDEILFHIRSVYNGKSVMMGKVNELLMEEFFRLQQTEKNLLFFVSMISELTRSEKQLVKCLLDGKKVREIAKLRNVEVVTVKTQLTRLLKKFQVNRTKKIVQLIHELNLEHLFYIRGEE
ncbi:MAG: response regulator transcription factor [Solibacillus sp.]